MRMIVLMQIVVTFLFTVVARGQEASPVSMLDAWGKVFVGSWISESELDSDLPGLGEKGDTLVGEIEFVAANGLYHATWKGTVKGKVVDSALGVVGWDPSVNKIRLQWYTRGGIKASSTYTRQGNTWTEDWEATLPGGINSYAYGVLKATENMHTWKTTKRTQGKEELPDRTVKWTKK